MKLAKRQARAKSKKQKFNQQKAHKAQSANKVGHKPAVPNSQPVAKTTKPAVAKPAVAKPEIAKPAEPTPQPQVSAEPTTAFAVNHPADVVKAVDTAIKADDLTPTIMGKLLNVGAAKVNKLLEDIAFQEAKETGKARQATTAGEAFLSKSKASGLTWKFAALEQIASKLSLELDQDLVREDYRTFVLSAA
ncbi:hypothetical protein K6Y31_16275 [Motilimonas cestriensis]|uniref:Uncharacterized protein n=1 Tax=Motilimonas cestriensis TaxID=2742685 RepID=A0ABS8WBG3_9GAMM|nr:hypothetical protein [Motilimonas cestriensis]MCE2596356.1 hypothetical protein [Motilimonas cestriensis]